MLDMYDLKAYRSLQTRYMKETGITMLFVVHGKGTVRINQHIYHVKRNQFFVVVPHDVFLLDFQADSVVCVLKIPFQSIEKLSYNLTTIYSEEIDNDTLKQAIMSLFKELFDNQNQISYTHDETCKRIIWKILFEISLVHTEQHDLKKDKEYHTIRNYIDQHHSEKVTQSMLSKALLMTEQHIRKVIKDTLGMNFPQFLRDVRLQHCLYDVLTTKKKLTDIAYEHGYTNSSKFISDFKSTYGNTPNQFRLGIMNLDMDVNNGELVPFDEQFNQLLMNSGHHVSATKPLIHNIKTVDRGEILRHPKFFINDFKIESLNYSSVQSLLINLKKHALNLFIIIDNWFETFNHYETTKEQLYWMKSQMHIFNELQIQPVIRINSTDDMVFNRKMVNSFFDCLYECLYEYQTLDIHFLFTNSSVQALKCYREVAEAYFHHVPFIYQTTSSDLLDKQTLINVLSYCEHICVDLQQFYQIHSFIPNSQVILLDIFNTNALPIVRFEDELQQLQLLMSFYSEIHGFTIPLKEIEREKQNRYVTREREITLESLPLFVHLIFMLHKLRGHILSVHDNYIITAYKQELQLVIIPKLSHLYQSMKYIIQFSEKFRKVDCNVMTINFSKETADLVKESVYDNDRTMIDIAKQYHFQTQIENEIKSIDFDHQSIQHYKFKSIQ
ncbi:AraC family transcriptional regulator [Staphylococcus massiliensis]|uniref:Transcriptional regulator n=1 Tax=Staphylococcus massiliensis S46 TaxID=1229783 RepID=K9B5E3_9STAP|nr:AraC family transcriptional regulator [Staphylococcus massiliensis]EKU48970.1 transcriptional regulator [Staphylococcus massiliensis S46]PNZ97339.1 AraC family transcriptional regulator [Staphylococcus massiliensis CCUG 55927]